MSLSDLKAAAVLADRDVKFHSRFGNAGPLNRARQRLAQCLELVSERESAALEPPTIDGEAVRDEVEALPRR